MRLIVFSMIALLFSCATQKIKERPSFYLASNQVIVLPTTSQQAGLSKTRDRITREIKSSLEKQGFAIVEVKPSDFEASEKEALDITGSIYNPKLKKSIPYNQPLYVRSLIKSLRTHYAFNAVIESEVELRDAVMKKNKAAWDGISEKIVIHNQPKNTSLPEKAKGVSIRVAAFTADGGTITRGYTGIAVPYAIYFQHGFMRTQLKRPIEWESKVPLAVKKALKPFYENVEVRHD